MTIHSGIYKKLNEIAICGETITYSELAPIAGLNMNNQADRNKIGEILGEISTFEHEHGRPMLSAIVVHAEGGMPGQGFFNLARQLGLLHKRDEFGEIDFYVSEVKKVFQYWSKHHSSS